MKNIKLIGLLSLILTLVACDSKEEIDIDKDDFLIFGFHYGFCGGTGCSAVYKLTDKSLFLAERYEYGGIPSEISNFIELDEEQFKLVEDLINFFPSNLLDAEEEVFGCPDCYDQGVLLVEYSKDGESSYWRIDTTKGSVPKYLHEFMDKMQEKFDLLKA